jgi:CO/xanthine dehydrogenase Mo-binding subunit
MNEMMILISSANRSLRQDILGHVTGTSPFFDDHKFDNLLHLKCVRSPHHHARILSIDISNAGKMPGVKTDYLSKGCSSKS